MYDHEMKTLYLCHNVGVHAMEKEGNTYCCRLPWYWAVTYVCWQCSYATYPQPKAGKFLLCFSLLTIYATLYDLIQLLNVKFKFEYGFAVWYNCNKQHLWRHTLWWGIYAYWKHWNATICQCWWIGGSLWSPLHISFCHIIWKVELMCSFLCLFQGPGLFEPIHGSAPDIAGEVRNFLVAVMGIFYLYLCGFLTSKMFRTRQILWQQFLVPQCFWSMV